MENNKDINEEKLQDISIEEIDEEENDYEDDYLVDDDEIEKGMNNLDEIQEKNENDMEIEINIEEKIHTEFPDVVTQGEIYSIAMNSHGFIVVGDGEDTTYFIDGNTKQIVKQEKTNKDSVNCVAFSSCEKYLATASLDGSCNIYETENYTILNTVNGSFSEINWIKWHPKGPVLSFGCQDGSVWVYHAQNINTNMSFFGHTDSVTVGLYSPDGKYLISGSEDFSVKVWELKNQVLSHTIKGKKFHQSPISALAVGRIKSIIATGSFSNELAISNYENGTVLNYLNVGSPDFSVEAIEFCNEDKYVIYAGTECNMQILDLTTMQVRMKIPLGTETITKILSSNLNIYNIYVSSSEGKFYVIDVRGNGSLSQEEKLHSDVLIDFVMSKDENFAVTSSLDRTINLVQIIKL